MPDASTKKIDTRSTFLTLGALTACGGGAIGDQQADLGYHVDPRVCPPRKPQHKGRVERTIRYLRDRHFAARTFSTIETGNAELLAFIHTIAGERPHPDQPERTIGDRLEPCRASKVDYSDRRAISRGH